MTIPVKYRKSADALMNYDVVDVLVGTAWAKYYLTDTAPQISYGMTKDVVYANKAVTENATGATVIDIDFDLKFGKQGVVNGDAFVTVPLAANHTSGHTMSWTFKIYHVDSAATATQLGSTVTAVTTWAGSATSEFRRSAKIAIDNQVFKKDDIFRVSIASDANPSTTTTAIAHDPKNRATFAGLIGDYTLVGSEAFVTIPFEVDL